MVQVEAILRLYEKGFPAGDRSRNLIDKAEANQIYFQVAKSLHLGLIQEAESFLCKRTPKWRKKEQQKLLESIFVWLDSYTIY